MARKVRGARPVREWAERLQRGDRAILSRFRDLHGGDDSLTTESVRDCLKAVRAFGESWGWDQDVLIVRSTGRTNLLGMHIDHRGGAVNAVAVRHAFLVAEPREDDTVVLRDVISGQFPEERFRIRECLPPHKIEDWDTWCHDEYEKRKGNPSVTWSNYVRAIVLYLQHLNTREDGSLHPPLRGMNAMMYGNIQKAAGLSTSSSLVVAAGDACMRINGLEMSSEEYIDSCGYAEWYVGTRGGAGDHAAIKLGRPNTIIHITSFPLTWDLVPFPPGYKIVLANSLVEAKKQVGARDAFNNRVAAYVLGFMLVRKNFPQYADTLRHLRDVNPETLGTDEVEIYRIVKSLPESADRHRILQLLADREAEVRHVFRSHAEPGEGYKIRQVCLFGISECIRANMAVDRLQAGDMQGFGELVNISHNGDRVTRVIAGRRMPVENRYPDDKIDGFIADLASGNAERAERARLWRQPGGYNVSVPEIDMLVDNALGCPGVIAARLVGAGLGGCIVAIVRDTDAQALIDRLAEQYYRPRGFPVRAEIVAPVAGAGVLD